MILGIDASNLRGGGGLTHLSELLRAARPEAHDVSRVVVWAGTGTADAIPARPWLEVVREPALDGSLLSRMLWQQVTLPRRARDVDALLSPAGTAPTTAHPQVLISQNMLPFEPSERARYGASTMHARLLALRALQGRAFSQADGVIFLTEFARERILRALGARAPKRTAIISHGVEPRFRRPPQPARTISECSVDDPLRALYVSVVSPYKHPWVVAEAFATLRAEGLPVRIDFVGAEEDAHAARRLRDTASRLDPRGEFISLRGATEFDEVHARYHDAELFVFASSCESMPNILLEAMAAGLPIACSERGPMPEILGDAGVYFDPEDPRELCARVRALIDEVDARERFARRAYERSLRFGWDRCADETLRFISDTVRLHRR